MTNVLPHLPDDLAHGLRPLDFSNLLPYPNDPILPGPTASPSHPVWPSIPLFSPLCSARSRLVPNPPTEIFPDQSPWLSNLSPLFRHVTDRDSDPSANLYPNLKPADFPPVWGPTVATDVAPAQDPTFSPATLTFTASSAATTLNDVPSSSFPATSTDPTLSNQPAPLQQLALPMMAEFPLTDQTAESQPMQCDKPVTDASLMPQIDVRSALSPGLTTSTQTVATSPGLGDAQSVSSPKTEGTTSTGGKKGKKGSPVARKTGPAMSSIDKAAERRRKNRESSSRCYYNRKRIIDSLDKKISAEKTRLTSLYDRALELRHENARLKKDVVTRGIALPTKRRVMRRVERVGVGIRGYVGMMQRTSYGK